MITMLNNSLYLERSSRLSADAQRVSEALVQMAEREALQAQERQLRLQQQAVEVEHLNSVLMELDAQFNQKFGLSNLTFQLDIENISKENVEPVKTELRKHCSKELKKLSGKLTKRQLDTYKEIQLAFETLLNNITAYNYSKFGKAVEILHWSKENLPTAIEFYRDVLRED